ncbi:hypothetical protein HDE_07915 [Halotydeus destructor]|nr:hypothetical protein HDE_07915 [Halotydeus destructor]
MLLLILLSVPHVLATFPAVTTRMENATGHCPPSWHRIGDTCYKALANFIGSYVSADSACRVKYHGKLAQPKTFYEQKIMSSSYFDPYVGHGHLRMRALWIGSLPTRYEANGFKWIDGTNVSQTNWEELEPSYDLLYPDEEESRFCIGISIRPRSKGQWALYDCRFDGLGALCQRPLSRGAVKVAAKDGQTALLNRISANPVLVVLACLMSLAFIVYYVVDKRQQN